ncbi:hypothetical protein BU16DRAFT_51206 [Lophium mytilinum]|uniref:Uncharacterized protein n=1 Tax=Lophium mytilinum TaxID=390894 RepID=A0A6A6QRB2_9PEZI|nr:hypothetical protein BU16DRAFT_51206 [Lophium mytilinum]
MGVGLGLAFGEAGVSASECIPNYYFYLKRVHCIGLFRVFRDGSVLRVFRGVSSISKKFRIFQVATYKGIQHSKSGASSTKRVDARPGTTASSSCMWRSWGWFGSRRLEMQR